MSSHSSLPTKTLLSFATVLLAAWTAAASAQCGGSPSPDAALRRVNAERAQGASCHGSPGAATAPPLRWNPGLAAVAMAQSDDMAALRQTGHRDSRDRPLRARLDATGYRFSTAVENVAVGYASFDTVVDAWLASDTHCANLMNAAVLELGLACSDAHADSGDRYWTLVLAAPSRR